MKDRNGIEIRTGDIVKITDAYFKNDNGLYFVEHSPGDVNWSGLDYSLKKISKKGIISKAKHNITFWPLISFTNNRIKRLESKAHNEKYAKIEVVYINNMADVIDYFEKASTATEKILKWHKWDGFGADTINLDERILGHYRAVVAYIQNAQ